MVEHMQRSLRLALNLVRLGAACGCLASTSWAQAPQPVEPDLRPVYEALDAGDLNRADALLARLRNNFVGWEPPPDLQRLLAEAHSERALEETERTGNPDALIAAGERYPEAFRCPRLDLAWPLADAYTDRGLETEAMAVYRRLITTCADADDRLATLYRALDRLPADMIGPLLSLEEDRPHTGDAAIGFALFKLRAARRNAGIDLDAAADALADAPGAGEDLEAMLELGWALRELGRADDALAAFTRATDLGAGDDARLAAAELALALGLDERAVRALANLEQPGVGHDLVEGLLAAKLLTPEPPPRSLIALAEATAARSQSATLEGLLALADALRGEMESARHRLGRARTRAGASASDPAAADRLAAAAWPLLDAGQPAFAAEIFSLADRLGADDAARGRARALIAAGDLDGARRAAEALNPSASVEAARVWTDLARLALSEGDRDLARSIAVRLEAVADVAEQHDALSGDIALMDGYAAYEAGRYEESAARAAEARAFGAEGAVLLLGWSLFQAGDSAAAAEAFAAALRGGNREEAVEGLALALQDLAPEARDRYAALSPEVAAAVAARSGENAFYRDQMYLARRRAGEALPALAGLEKGWLQSGLAFRHTKGAPGIDRFTLFSPYLAARAVSGAEHVTAVLELPRIKAGRGTQPPGQIGPKRETTLVPTLTWVREGETMDLRAGISTTPIGGEVSVLPTFDLGLTRYLDGGGRIDFALRGQSRVDSLLSYAGSNDGFGRVVEYGASAQIQKPFGNWTVNAELHASLLDGEDVEDNSRIGGNIGLMRGFDLTGFDYVSVGPTLTLDHYDENLDFFTFGNGGFFSPQFFALSAIAAAFQTQEAQNFVLRGVVLAGGEVIRRDAGFDNPFDRSSSRLPASDQSGPVATSRFEGVYRLSPRWSLVGDFASAFTDDFTEYRAGIALRFSFGARPVLTSADIFLPRQGFSQR